MGSGMLVEPLEISTLLDCCIVTVSSIVLGDNTDNPDNLGFLSCEREGTASLLGTAVLALRCLRWEGLAGAFLLSGPRV